MKTIYTKHSFIYILLALLLVAGCTKEADPAALAPVIKGLETEYFPLVNEKLTLKPEIQNNVTDIEWLLDGKKVATTPEYTFQAPATPGISRLLFRASNADNITQLSITITIGRYLTQTTSPGKMLTLETTKNLEGKSVKWEMIKASSSLYRLSDTKANNPLFVAAGAGTYQLRAVAENLADTLVVAVKQQLGGKSPYITTVFDYMPAPGQFVNKLPQYENGDTHEKMVEKAGKYLIGADPKGISIGGWGGYVTFGFDHTITNVAGKRDFRVFGNAFGANDNKRPNAPFGGSCEPGIIMVAYDKNKNGKPDNDEWYEIKGSGNFTAEKEPWHQFAKEEGNDVATYRDYEMTYYRPTTEKTDVDYNPKKDIALIKKYIKWTDNKGREGYKIKNQYNDQTYFPAWVKEDKLTYKGIRLADNGLNEYKFNPGINETGMYYVLYAFRYGYVDNYPNIHDNSAIDIDWAITKDGKPANLPGIDFVKVYNGVDKENGWLGEASTEVAGAQDLHMLGIDIKTIKE